MTGETIVYGLQSFARLAWYLAVFQLIGVIGALGVISRGPSVAPWGPRIRRIGLIAALALLVIVVIRLPLQTYSIFGMEEGFSLEGMRIVVFDTQWGTGWLWQFGASIAAAALTAFVAAGMPPALLGVAALGVGATLPLTGHAVAETWPVFFVITQAVHVICGGLWLGTLSLLLMFIFARGTNASSLHASWIRTFSPLALTGAALLLVSGGVTTLGYVDFPTALWTTPYGGVLTAKVVLVGLVAACGAYNWRQVRPGLDRPDGVLNLRRWAVRELGFAFLVLAATSVLVALPKDA